MADCMGEGSLLGRTRLSLALAGLGLFASSSAHAEEVMAREGQRAGILGSAYSSDREEFRGSECVTGTATPTGGSESSISFDQTMDETQLSNDLGFGLGGRVRYGVVEASAAANFLKRSASGAFSITAIYKGSYSFPKQHLTNFTYTAVGTGVRNNQDRWNETCGDRYVDEVRRGAKLFVSLRVDFSSNEDKQAFQAEFSVAGPMASATGSLKTASQSFRRSARITVSAYQYGGDVSKLSRIFGDNNNGREFYVQCSLGQFQSCASLIGHILAYGTDTKTGFPSQLGTESQVNAAVVSYSVAPYSALGIYDIRYPGIEQATQLARQTLASKFEQNYKVYVSADRLLQGTLSQERRDRVDAALTNAKSNIGVILPISKTCYETPNECYDAVEHKLKLAEIDPNALDPVLFEQACVSAIAAKDGDPGRETLLALSVIAWGQPSRFPADKIDCAILLSKMRKMTAISFASEEPRFPKVSDLTMLGALTQLTSLNLSGQNVRDLSPLLSLADLTVLDLSRNRVQDVSALAGLPELTDINLAYNQITSIAPLSTLTNVRSLNIASNRIQSLSSLASWLRLKALDISYNDIKSLQDFTATSRLQYLTLIENLIGREDILALGQRLPNVRIRAPSGANEWLTAADYIKDLEAMK